MARTLLQEMVEGTSYESLPANWSSFDLRSLSRQKQLTARTTRKSKVKRQRPKVKMPEATQGGGIRRDDAA